MVAEVIHEPTPTTAVSGPDARGEMQVVRDFACQIPMTVILDLMGVPDLDERLRPDTRFGVTGRRA